MTGPYDARLTPPPGAGGEDPEIAGLIRDVAGRWKMPPRRIDSVTWRDRVAGGRSSPWRRRLAAGGALALVSTLVVAVVGAWLSGPRPPASAGPGASPAPLGSGFTATPAGPSASAGASTAAAPSESPGRLVTPLPLIAHPVGPTDGLTTLVQVESAYRVLDLATGRLSDPIGDTGSGAGGTRVFPLRDGSYLCVCATFGPGTDGGRLDVVLRRFDATGRRERDLGTLSYRATSGMTPDGAYVVQMQPAVSPDGSLVALGWTILYGDRWRSGVDLMSGTDASILGRVGLPDLPLTLDGTLALPPRWKAYEGSGQTLYPWAPTVSMAPDGRSVVIGRSMVADAVVKTEWWTATLNGGRLAAPVAQAGPGSLADGVCADSSTAFQAFASSRVFAALCTDGTTMLLRRVGPNGVALGDVDLAPIAAAGSAFFATGVALDAHAGILYLWDPFGRRVTRVDAAGGKLDASAVLKETASAPGEILDWVGSLGRALGRLLVPDAAAKNYLHPSIAVSPDGTRLYVITTTATSFETTPAGSLGVWVIDTGSLRVIGRWAPTSDLVSIAVSRDGKFVLAAGGSGVDATGASTTWEASVTAYDASSGAVRALAGRLGQGFVSFVDPGAP